MRCVATMLLALIGLPLQAAELQPFSATYTTDSEKVPVSGTSGRALKALGNGCWELSFEAAVLVIRFHEVSTFCVEDGTFLPQTYRYERRSLGKSREVEQDFDWAGRQVVGNNRGKPVRIALERGMLDNSTYQLVLQQDVAAGKKSMSYQVADGNEISTYDFRVLGEERVPTQAGWIAAVKVERVRDPAESSRKTVMWFAKDWGHLLVRLHQVEEDGKEYQVMLKEGTVNGRAVKGIEE